MLNCVVLDDEPLARYVLEGYLSRLDFVGPVLSFGTPAHALAYLEQHATDVLFLDIDMPGMSGLDFLRALTDPPITVFTTAYRDYAFEGFELGVIDFLLKPISFPRFGQTLDKVREFISLRGQPTRLVEPEVGEGPETILVKSGVERIRLTIAEVTHIQGLKDYAIIYSGTSKVVLKGSIKAMHTIFPPTRFVRVHKSFIVALSHVTRIERNRLVLKGSQIPIGRSYRDDLEAALLRHRR